MPRKAFPLPSIKISVLGVEITLTRYDDSICLQAKDTDGEGLYLGWAEVRLLIAALQTLLEDAP